MDKLTFLWRGARDQDNLLQAYRSFHFMLQSVFLAICSGLTVGIVFFGHGFKVQAIYCLLMIFTVIGIYSLQAMRKLIAARSADVNYYHKLILVAEKELPETDRILTAFKVYQKNKKNSSVYASHGDLTDAERMRLIEKDKGHTRQLLDNYLSYGFYLIWLSIQGIALFVILFR